MSLFGTWQSMENIQTVDNLLDFYQLSPVVWRAVVEQLGSPGQDIRVLAALPSTAIIAAVNAAYLSESQGLSPVQATQVGLVWRLARRAVAFHSGLKETEFHDTDPWESRSAEVKPSGGTASGGGGTGVKERVLKMNSLIDQADDSELLPPTPNQVSSWRSLRHRSWRHCIRELWSRVMRPTWTSASGGLMSERCPRCRSAGCSPRWGTGAFSRRSCQGHRPFKRGRHHGTSSALPA